MIIPEVEELRKGIEMLASVTAKATELILKINKDIPVPDDILEIVNDFEEHMNIHRATVCQIECAILAGDEASAREGLAEINRLQGIIEPNCRAVTEFINTLFGLSKFDA